MRSDDIVQQRFRTTRFQPGYEQREVDSFLDRAAVALRSHEGGLATLGSELDARQVEAVRFTQTRMREGYDANEVDDFLDALASAMRRLEGGAPAR